MDDGLITAWYPSWLWSLPLIVLTVVIHVVGLSLINERVVRPLSGIAQRRQFTVGFVIIMAVVAWLVTLLHAIEGFTWAVAYKALGAVPDMNAAVLYSFSAMTAFVQRHDGLRACQRSSGAALAAHGSLGGIERVDAVRADHRLHVRRDRTGLAAASEEQSLRTLTERRARRPCDRLIVMAGLGPAIHVFAAGIKKRRG
jgi:hypothetical protein